MIPPIKHLSPGKKIFFASDFHLGAPNAKESQLREKKIIAWLDSIKDEAEAIFLVGDIFDFWFEYKHTIPKGFIRFQGKLAELSDRGIPIYMFTGNHDMWLFDYFSHELNIPVFRKPVEYLVGNKKFLIGHGDGLGPKDHLYKILKKIFENKLCQWLFGAIHPNIGITIANYWSRSSRISQNKKEDKYLGEDEWLLIYCKDIQKQNHHDYYIFGHRHLPLDINIDGKSRYMNLGEWVNHFTYAEFDGQDLKLKKFE